MMMKLDKARPFLHSFYVLDTRNKCECLEILGLTNPLQMHLSYSISCAHQLIFVMWCNFNAGPNTVEPR